MNSMFDVPCPQCSGQLTVEAVDLRCPRCRRVFHLRMGHLFPVGEGATPPGGQDDAPRASVPS